MPLSDERKDWIAAGRARHRQRLHAHPAPEAVVVQVADEGRLGKYRALRFVLAVDVLGRRYEVMAEPGNDRSKRLAREAERRVIDARARGAGWQKVLGAVLVSGDAVTFDDPYVVGSWREAQNLAAELACLGGLAPGGVELLSGLGFLDCGEYVRAGFRRD